MKGDGDYSPYLSDPDLMVPWESIEQIVSWPFPDWNKPQTHLLQEFKWLVLVVNVSERFSLTEPTIQSCIICLISHFITLKRIWGSEVGSCPICLHQPVAAKMTRCGHIYCWPCILHFLALSDKPSRPCPICDSAIRVGDLRRYGPRKQEVFLWKWNLIFFICSVIALEQRAFGVGDVIELKLMKRERFSLQPQPVRRMNAIQTDQPFMIHQLKPGEDHVFNKLLACTPNDVLRLMLPEERRELEAQFEAEKDCPEACFIQQALELLSQRECAIQGVLADVCGVAKVT